MQDDPNQTKASLPGRNLLSGLACAGSGGLGLLGVMVSAAAAHSGGGPLATTAGQFCLFHAGALLGLAALSGHARFGRVFGWAAALLGLGALAFSGDLAAAGLFGLRPFPPAAPIGGTLLLLGWLLVLIGGVLSIVRGR